MQKKPEDHGACGMDLQNILSEPRNTKTTKSYTYSSSNRASSPPRTSAANMSPCCQSPCMHPHTKSTPSTPCPVPSPATTVPCSPAISPAPSQLPNITETQDKRAKGQTPQDYPHSMEPDLPPEYSYPAIATGYRSGPSPRDIQLAEPAELEALPVEPVQHAPAPLANINEGPACHAIVRPITESQLAPDEKNKEDLVQEQEQADLEQNRESNTLGCCVPVEHKQIQEEEALLICQSEESSTFEAASCPSSWLEKPVHKDSTIVCQEDGSLLEKNDVEKKDEPQTAPAPEHLCVQVDSADLQPNTATEVVTEETEKEHQEKDCVQILSAPSSPISTTPLTQLTVPSYWSLELLIAAAFCGDCPPPSPPASTTSQGCAGTFYASTYGIELLSELADLERQQEHHRADKSEGQEQLIFDLQSLATLAVARALELDSKVFPVKSAMDAIDSQELAMRVRLADLQRRYKEKQKELVKLQRKHDHQKEETPRSPARRGPGRPRKRKSNGLGPVAPPEPQKKVKSMGVVVLTEESGRGGGDLIKKRRLSNRSFARLGAVQVKMQSSQKSSLHEHHIAQLKSRPSVSRTSRDFEILGSADLYTSHRSPKADSRHSNMTAIESEGQSDTGSGDSGSQKSWKGLRNSKKKNKVALNQGSHCVQQPLAKGHDVAEDVETFAEDTESSEQEEEKAESSYNIDVGHCIKVPPSRDLPSSAILKDPSPSSVVKLEVNQKAKNKRERQEQYGSQLRSNPDSEVKVKKKPHCRSTPDNAVKTLGVRRRPGRPRLQEKLWAGHYRKPAGLLSFSSTSERLRRATRKSSMLRGVLSKAKSWSAVVQSPGIDESCKRRTRFRQSKGRAVCRLLESFAADDGFQMGGGSSFSDEDEENSLSSAKQSPAPPSCVLTKDLLTEGLKILISKEDELLYAARVRMLDLPDIYSIVIDGERGNRPRMYSLEQLLQEATYTTPHNFHHVLLKIPVHQSPTLGHIRFHKGVQTPLSQTGANANRAISFCAYQVLDVRPESDAVLAEGIRVCAYWSERSRCLYPGYVRRGGSNYECKPGGVMVEFDDGDRGWISLRNIRLLPPGYQIHYAESNPALVSSPSDQIVSCQEGKSSQVDRSFEKASSTEKAKTKKRSLRKPGRPKGSGLKKFISDVGSKTSESPLTWPSIAQSRKRAPVNLFQINGSTNKKIIKNKEAVFSYASVSATSSAKCIFNSRTFEVDSFSSIANGFSSFCSQTSGMTVESRSSPYGQGRKSEETDIPRGRKNEFLIKLDHEGVMNPKNKSSKALLMLGGSGFGSKGIGAPPKPETYSHPVLLVKDKRKGDSCRAELLPVEKKTSPSLVMSKHGDMGHSCHMDCHSSYSDMDEEDEEEAERRTRNGSVLVPASGGMRMTGRFLSQLSVSSSSSGSSSSSSSGSISSSSICSSDNDSSYSSEDDENSTLLLQSCLSPHLSLLHSHKAPPGAPQHSFVAKAMAVSSSKGGNVDSAPRKTLKRKECLVKKQNKKMLVHHNRPKVSSCMLWRWSGNPTQRRGLKGKARKLFYKSIVRGKDTVHVGDCAVFLSAGRPHLPYIGRIESFWETWTSNMIVKVKWFYHPEETNLDKRLHDGKHALYQSCHEDENDVQTISHKCQVVSRKEYEVLNRNRKPGSNVQDLYYLAGTYDPTSGQLLTADGVSIHC
ncbi:BAH and coiled-coil domain-containing protein 1 [Bagarius yarrelli]|uniref:BAH and coiled-coil domain-containing protein 1 n=1 Tax=Bagarius yarrelli TaxID=175774 RepID=A0A556TVY4_BAGYA|nr:BAH and coiled-coil domain-containing protein 1 [Bagarius yarrelli]